MVTGIIGKKVGMTQVFGQDGTATPGTVIQAGPCVVVQAKSKATDGYEAVQIGLVEATPDMTISEMLDKLAAERDVYAARATLWTFLDRCGLTFKKRPRTRPSRTARIS